MANTVLYLILIEIFCFFIATSGKTRIINLEMEPLYIKAGTPLRLACEQTQGFKTKWLRLAKSNLSTDSSVQSAQKYEPITIKEGFHEQSFEKQGNHLSIITKEVIELNDTGSYSCDVLNNLDRSYYVDVNVFEVVSYDGVMVKPGEKTNLACRFNSDEKITPVLSWYKDGRRIDHDNDPGKYLINSTWLEQSTISHLFILRTYEQDIGTYECRLMLASNVTFTHPIQLNSVPIVRISDRSVVVKEDDTTKINCLVSGWPTPRVQWFKGHDDESLIQNVNFDDDEENALGRIFARSHMISSSSSSSLTTTSELKLLSPPSSSSPPTYANLRNDSKEFYLDLLAAQVYPRSRSHNNNSTLIITEAKLSDRDVYVCEASSEVGNSTTLRSRAVIMVRVKGRYACLYPLVGVIMEFVVLIIIIIIYERKKRRNAEKLAGTEENNLFQPLVRKPSENKSKN